MEYITGVALALGICFLATVVGLDRDRAFYPTLMIVIASYYGLFAVIGGSLHALMLELVGIAAFALLSLIGFRLTLWWVVGALVAHGVFDWFHGRLIADPGVPSWWPMFCVTYDVVAAAYLSWLLGVSRVAARSSRVARLTGGFSHRIRPYVQVEFLAAEDCDGSGDFAGSFGHLERAHVLGQGSTREHVRVHWRMLRWAARQRQTPELVAQLLRIVGAAVFTAAGLVPEGNTGGGNVSAFRRLPVPPELALIIASVRSA
jgi:uncharacterized protein DUF3703